MKKIKHILITFLILFLSINCSRDKADDSYLYDQDEDCVFGVATCCDIDGRILVKTNTSYIYTNSTSFDYSTMEWEVISGDISIVDGQNTNEATIHFGNNFITGVIRTKTTGIEGSYCENTLEINKL
ncbi:hypothetical protein [Flavobacterium capsici]|uniref:Uncharacterized protein n=1 Tax=Flavobacterium capsici TaxID=3075618 RepID=A0AA96J5P2_9FLAO|nr:MULTISPECIES: hypothetical protein [unclassified Flavobacterium]WNM19171.1 hypothetical protein RN608_00460 [Flavobacterium sp. PMR2A8]WNM20560.1 hypothetical protein RN605_07630 [Flavobacterium sp. PMTSA4]